MSLFENAINELADRNEQPRSRQRTPDPPTTTVAGQSVPIETHGASVTVGGEAVDVEEPETAQTSSDTWLSSSDKYGHPRGREAIEARQIVQTSAMQAIANGIVDQLLGGELTAESDDELSGPAAAFWDLLRDILHGPHLMDDDLDDLIAAAVEDMLGPGNAYWQMLPSANGDLPVASLIPLDALTIRHNVNKHGYPQDPPYYQARGAFSSSGATSIGDLSPTSLDESDLVVMRYPRGRRSHRFYPLSPSIQVKEWLEILANSTTHHNRFYSDNQVPPGLLQILNASDQTVDDVSESIQAAAGDPRSVEVVGGEGQAMWVEMGGTSVNLDILGEQEWFFQLCLASLGLGKAEVGLIEDVNRANGEIEASRIYKRVTGPFAQQFENAFRHIANQFEAYQDLDDPFDVRLRFTDPREERAREERLRQMWQADGLTLREYVRRRGDTDLAEDDDRFTVEVGGETIDYGDHPKFVVENLLRDARASVPEDAAEDAAAAVSETLDE